MRKIAKFPDREVSDLKAEERQYKAVRETLIQMTENMGDEYSYIQYEVPSREQAKWFKSWMQKVAARESFDPQELLDKLGRKLFLHSKDRAEWWYQMMDQAIRGDPDQAQRHCLALNAHRHTLVQS